MSNIKGVQIALAGEMRSGKDTVAEYLKKFNFKRYAFGDGIREVTKLLFPHEFDNGKPRKLLQDFGQEQVKRYKKVWIDYTFRKMLYDGIDPNEDNVVITDLRQQHEYEALVESGFMIVRVNAKPHVRKQRIIQAGEEFSEETFNHSTEKFIRTFEVDYELYNNEGEQELIDQINKMLSNITGGGVKL